MASWFISSAAAAPGDVPVVGGDEGRARRGGVLAGQDVAVGLGSRLEDADLVGGVDGLDQVTEPGVAYLVRRDVGGGIGERDHAEPRVAKAAMPSLATSTA